MQRNRSLPVFATQCRSCAAHQGIKVAGHLQGADTLRCVDEQRDSRQNVGELQLTAGEDRAAGNAELLTATLALPTAARLHEIGIDGTTCRAERLATIGGKADSLELLLSFLLTHFVHVLELQGTGRCGQEEIGFLWHCTISDNFISNIV